MKCFERWYLALAVLRCILTLSPGYVHPDEFFQSGEVAAAQFAHIHAGPAPWEFNADRPIRSLLTTAVASSSLLRPLSALEQPNTWVLLCASRIPYLALSFVVDASIVSIGRAHLLPAPMLLLLFAGAWPTLVLSVRSFSNVLEQALFAVTLAIVLAHPPTHGDARGPVALQNGAVENGRRLRVACALGALLAIGCWVRFTFAFFWAAPFLVFACSPSAGNPNQLSSSMAPAIRRTVAAAVTAVAVGAMLLCADCALYGGVCRTTPWRCIAPLNALRYNLSTRNLAEHGLHPRLTHLALNLPLLSGPMAVPALWDVVIRFGWAGHALHAAARGKGLRFESSNGNAPQQMRHAALRRQLFACIALPLAILSAAPHQEPRFLLPLLLPVTLLHGSWVLHRSSRLLAWVIFHAALTCFFVVMHQAGVVRALAYVQAGAHTSAAAPPINGAPRAAPSRQPAAEGTLLRAKHQLPASVVVVFFHTYPPPQFLLGQSSKRMPPKTQVVALPSSAGLCELYRALRKLRRRWSWWPWAEHVPVYLAAPGALINRAPCGGSIARGRFLCTPSCRPRWTWNMTWKRSRSQLRLELEQRFWPHWSAEDLPDSLGEADLRLYRVRSP